MDLTQVQDSLMVNLELWEWVSKPPLDSRRFISFGWSPSFPQYVHRSN